MTIQRISASLLLVFLAALPAGAQILQARAQLRKMHVLERLRIFYAEQGDQAVDPADENRNGTPDQVEDIAAQTWTAYTLLVKGLGLPDPFEGERYRGAAFVDIRILDKAIVGSNGVTYDEPSQSDPAFDKEPRIVVRFDVARSVYAPKNATAAHEMFHVIQNGATYFKTRWYTEGSARWSEFALNPGATGDTQYDPRGVFPQPPQVRADLFNRTYDAAPVFWYPLAKRLGTSVIPAERIPAGVSAARYVNGQPILRDAQLAGWQFMREVFKELPRAQKTAFAKLGYQNWSEDNQKSIANSPFIYQAVMDAARRIDPAIGPFVAEPSPAADH